MTLKTGFVDKPKSLNGLYHCPTTLQCVGFIKDD